MTSAAPRVRTDSGAIAQTGRRLRELLDDRVVSNPVIREQHGHTLTWLGNQPPDLVAFPCDTTEVSAIVRICANNGVPVIPFGAGTSVEGHVNAPFGGVCVDLSRMDRILAVRPDDLDCTVEPGVKRNALNRHLRDVGLFFPVDPGADASIGGMVATRASGTNAVRYGTMTESVLSLTTVLPDGQTITTSRRARKSSAGYDLTRLFVGAEGTLGIVTEITLRLHGIPEAISAGICPFPDIASACRTAILAIQSGLPVARMELLDALQVKACNAHSKLVLPERPLLLVEFHGSDDLVREQADRFGEIAAELGGGPFDWATRTEDRARLWQSRHDAYWAAVGLRPGSKGISTDVCVPISRLAECIIETHEDIARSGLIAPIVGHVGDGNFHVLPLVDPDNRHEVAAVEAFMDRLVRRALAMDGTCTGEHGIGQGKAKYLIEEHGEPALRIMQAIKRAIDPQQIMNPGKIADLV